MKFSDRERFKSYIIDIISSMKYLESFKNKPISEISYTESLAIERSFEIIGEATKRLFASNFYTKYPEIEWSEMSKNRDFIIHHYDTTDIEVLLSTIKNSITKNLILLEKLLEEEYGTK